MANNNSEGKYYTENAESINNTQLALNVHKELKMNRMSESIMLINYIYSVYNRMVAGSRSKLIKIKTIRLILYVYNIYVLMHIKIQILIYSTGMSNRSFFYVANLSLSSKAFLLKLLSPSEVFNLIKF